MKTRYALLFTVLLLSSAQVFSKGHPPVIFALHNSASVLYYTPGTYYVNGQTANFPNDTLTLEMLPGDTCTIGTSGASGYPVVSFRIYRNDTLVHDKPGGGQHHVFLPGKYRVVSNNGFTMYPQISITFYVRSQATALGEVAPAFVSPLLYPNPCIHAFSIKAGSQDLNGSLSVVDVNGKQVWNESVFNLTAGSQHSIATDSWQAGLYIVQVFTGKETQRFRIVKN